MTTFLRYRTLKISPQFLMVTRLEIFSLCLFRQDIRATYDSKIFGLHREESTYEARKKYYEGEKAE